MHRDLRGARQLFDALRELFEVEIAHAVAIEDVKNGVLFLCEVFRVL